MTWVAVAIGGSALLGYAGAKQQAGAATGAAEKQYQASLEGIRQQREMFDILNKQQAPYREAGYGGLSKIQEMLPYFTKQPTAEDIQSMPGYQFALKQGLGAVSQGGNVLSPGSNVDVARQKFATDYTLGQALPAYQNMQTNIFNRLASIAGIGQTAQGQTQTLGTGTASNIANLGIGGASALGAGQIGAANAMAGGLQGIGNAGMMYSLMRPQSGAINLGPSAMPSSSYPMNSAGNVIL